MDLSWVQNKEVDAIMRNEIFMKTISIWHCFGIPCGRSWISRSNPPHGMQCIRREPGWKSQQFNYCKNEIKHKPAWRILRELRSESVQDVHCRNTVMAKTTWSSRCKVHWNSSTIIGHTTQRQWQQVVHQKCRTSWETNQGVVIRVCNWRITEEVLKFIEE